MTVCFDFNEETLEVIVFGFGKSIFEQIPLHYVRFTDTGMKEKQMPLSSTTEIHCCPYINNEGLVNIEIRVIEYNDEIILRSVKNNDQWDTSIWRNGDPSNYIPTTYTGNRSWIPKQKKQTDSQLATLLAQIAELTKKVNDLTDIIQFAPGGPEYQEAKTHFESCV